MIEVRRDDGELCGYVRQADDEWRAADRLRGGARLARLATRRRRPGARARAGVARRAVAGSRRTEEAQAEIVCIQEADPTGVTLALGYYSLPGVPTMRVTRSQLDAGEWVLER